jgi:taurine dioxygenase
VQNNRCCGSGSAVSTWKDETVSDLVFRPVSPSLGVEVEGVDLSADLSAETVNDLRKALLQHHVLFFREQTLTPQQQMTFGRRFGELDEHPFVVGRSDYPEILEVITEPDDVVNFGGGWHIDVTFLEEPDMGSILYAVDVPKTSSPACMLHTRRSVKP